MTDATPELTEKKAKAWTLIAVTSIRAPAIIYPGAISHVEITFRCAAADFEESAIIRALDALNAKTTFSVAMEKLLP